MEIQWFYKHAHKPHTALVSPVSLSCRPTWIWLLLYLGEVCGLEAEQLNWTVSEDEGGPSRGAVVKLLCSQRWASYFQNVTDYTTFEVLSPKKHRSWFIPRGRVKHVTIITSLKYWQLTSRLILHCYCHLVRDAQGGRPECCCCVPGYMTCKWKESARLLSLDIFPTDSKQTTHLLTYWLPLGNISISIRELPSLHYIWFTLCEMTDGPSGYKTTHFLTLVFNHFLANITVGHLLYQMS